MEKEYEVYSNIVKIYFREPNGIVSWFNLTHYRYSYNVIDDREVLGCLIELQRDEKSPEYYLPSQENSLTIKDRVQRVKDELAETLDYFFWFGKVW